MSSVVKAVIDNYKNLTPLRFRLIDCLITALLVLVGLQCWFFSIEYRRIPINAFLASVFACGGVALFTLILRIQQASPGHFADITPQAAFGDWVICCLILLTACINFLG